MRITHPLAVGALALLLLTVSVFAEDQDGNNKSPVAHPGSAQSAVIGEVVSLDGSGSSDLDGDRLNFHWVLHTPPGSAASLDDDTAMRPQFTVDALGTYAAELVVEDGQVNSPAQPVLVSTGNVAPIAVAETPESAVLGQVLILDASDSFDPNGDPLTFAWRLASAPEGAERTVSQARAARASFVPELSGTYEFVLTVSDGRLESEPNMLRVTTHQQRPRADAGADRRMIAGQSVRLHANQSDRQKDATFDWSLLYAPPTSRVSLDGEFGSEIDFRTDVAGDYLVQLVVYRNGEASDPDTVVITAHSPVAGTGPATRGGGSDVDGDGVPDDVDNCAEIANPDQLDTNGDGFGNRCDADIDNDGFITNFGDLVIWVDSFNSAPGQPNWNPDADFNGDNVVNFIDLFIFQGFFLTAPGPVVNRFVNPLGGSWHDAANWSLGIVPNSTHSARIDVGSGVSVEYSTGGSEVSALRSSTPMVFSGGDLLINGVMQVDAPTTLSGNGVINRATILPPSTGDSMVLLASETFRLQNVSLGANLNIEFGGDLRINDDLTLTDGAVVTLNSNNNFTYLRFVGLSGETSLLDGNGEIVFSGTTTIAGRNSIEVFNSADGLIIGPDVTIRTGSAPGSIDHRFNNGPIVLNGSLVADAPGAVIDMAAAPLTVNGSVTASNNAIVNLSLVNRTLTLSSSAVLTADTGGELQLRGDFVNEGTITVDNATLDLGDQLVEDWTNTGTINLIAGTIELGGDFTVADIGTFSGTGTAIIDGRLDNTGLTLDIGADLPGDAAVLGDGGIIVGGTVTNTPLTLLSFDRFTLEDLVLEADAFVEAGGDLRIHDRLTMSGSTISLLSNNQFTYLRFLGVTDTATELVGNGEIRFDGTATVFNRNSVQVFDSQDSLLIGPDITLRAGTASGLVEHRFNNGAVTFQGSVLSDVAGQSVTFEASPLTIEGDLTASDSGLIDLIFLNSGGLIASSAVLTAVDNGEIELSGDWINEGTINVTNATLDLGDGQTGSWDNNGTIVLDNATLQLGGSYTLDNIGNTSGTGTLVIDGLLDNTGTTLDVATLLPGGTVVLGDFGTIVGGTIAAGALTVPGFDQFNLDAVTLSADILVEAGADLRVHDSLTFAGGSITLASNNNFTYLRLFGITGSEVTLDGTGEILFGGSATVVGRNSIEVFNSFDSATLGPNVTLRALSAPGSLDHRFNNGNITVQGAVIADQPGQTILLDASPLVVSGSLQASNAAIVDTFFRGAGGQITASANLTADTGGELQLRGSWLNEGTINVTDATLDLGEADTDTWDNNGTVVLSNATLELGGAFAIGDIGTMTGSAATSIDGLLDNTGQTLDVGVDVPGTTVVLGDGGTLLGGEVVNTPLTLPSFDQFALENVTLSTDLIVEDGGDLRVNDDLTISTGASVRLESSNSFTYLRVVAVTSDTSTIDGAGDIVFGGTTAIIGRNQVEVFNSLDELVIGPDVTIRSESAPGSIDSRFSNGAITVNGSVTTSGAGNTVRLDAAPLTINGTLSATDDALLDVFFRNTGGSLSASAVVTATSGAEVQLSGEWDSAATITVTDALLDIGTGDTQIWDNNGTITLNNSTVELGGAVTVTDVGTISGTGTVIINGQLDNTGQTLDTAALVPGIPVVLGDGGTLVGGTVANTPITVASFGDFSFENVTLATDLTVEDGGDARVLDNLTLSSGATVSLESNNNFTYLRFVAVTGDTSLLTGSGEVVFNGTATVNDRNRVEVFNSADNLVVGSGVTIRTGTAEGRIMNRFNNGAITLQGPLISDLEGGTLSVTAAPLLIEGAIQIGAGSIIDFDSEYTLASTASLDVDLGGTAQSQFGRVIGFGEVANLGGALNINLVNGFSPALADTFAVLMFGSANGTFDSVTGTNLGGGLSFDVNYNAADVTLEVIN